MSNKIFLPLGLSSDFQQGPRQHKRHRWQRQVKRQPLSVSVELKDITDSGDKKHRDSELWESKIGDSERWHCLAWAAASQGSNCQ